MVEVEVLAPRRAPVRGHHPQRECVAAVRGAGVDEVDVLDDSAAGGPLVHTLAGAPKTHVDGPRGRSSARDLLNDAVPIGAVHELGFAGTALDANRFVLGVVADAAATAVGQVPVAVVNVRRLTGDPRTDRVRTREA